MVVIGHVNIEVIFSFIENSKFCLFYATHFISDRIFITMSLHHTDWLVLDENEKATLRINMPYLLIMLSDFVFSCKFMT